jgi:hypothetical protein
MAWCLITGTLSLILISAISINIYYVELTCSDNLNKRTSITTKQGVNIHTGKAEWVTLGRKTSRKYVEIKRLEF